MHLNGTVSSSSAACTIRMDAVLGGSSRPTSSKIRLIWMRHSLSITPTCDVYFFVYVAVAANISPSLVVGSLNSAAFSIVACGVGVVGLDTVKHAAVAVFGDIIAVFAGASGGGELTVATGSGSLSGDSAITGVDLSADDAVIGVELVNVAADGGAETGVAVLSRSLRLSPGILGLASRFASLAFLLSLC